MEAEAVVDTLTYTVAEEEARKRGETLVDIKTEALVKTLAHTIVELEAKTFGDTLDKEASKSRPKLCSSS